MKWLAAGLMLVNVATISGLAFGILSRGLTPADASTALALGVFAAILAYFRVFDSKTNSNVFDSANPAPPKLGQRQLQRVVDSPPILLSLSRRYNLAKWIVVTCFVLFAVRSFCCLVYIDGDQLKIQSPNNLGDLALHITYIKNFANGVPLWPDNPIYVGSKLRYPAGADLFNALLYLFHVDLIHGLVWAGFLGSLATFYAFYRWGGTFGVAGFLFNGGVAGFQILYFFNTSTFLKFSDYQGVNTVAWKSIPLSMLVTQRGLLYAIPAGLLLLWHWREKFFRSDSVAVVAGPATAVNDRGYSPLPFWVELSLYASMPLFHVHTFLALSAVLVLLAAFGDGAMHKHIALLLASAFIPATFFVWLITDHFRAASVLALQPGWVQHDGDFAAPFFTFWLYNFGIWIPLVIALIVMCGWRAWKSGWRWGHIVRGTLDALGMDGWSAPATSIPPTPSVVLSEHKIPEDLAFLLPAAAIFIFAFFVKTAPWGWDNLKIMIWSYFLVLPFLWSRLIAKWPMPVRVGVCIALFGSGFVSLFGGLAAGRTGYGFADRAELDGVGHAIRKLPAEARFAAFPTYNHPLLLHGRKVVLGYPGHLWTEGFDYGDLFQRLGDLMNGAENWREIARRLQVRYVFWGREETMNYAVSKRPWEKTAPLIASGSWGAIYDLQSSTNQHE